MAVIPSAFLFRYTLPVLRVDRLPRAKTPLLKLPDDCRLPWPGQLDGGQQFGQLSVAWNPNGLAIQVTVAGKTESASAHHTPSPAMADTLLIWVDTRDTQSQHRGSRFCHLFAAFPYGEDSGGTPEIRQLPVPRAREDAPEADAESLMVEVEPLKDGYRMSVWLPREALHGFDPGAQNRLGFMVQILDVDLGIQYFTVNADFPIEADPSLWTSLELTE